MQDSRGFGVGSLPGAPNMTVRYDSSLDIRTRPPTTNWWFIIMVWHRRDCLMKLEGLHLHLHHQLLPSRNCICSPECLPGLARWVRATLIGRGGPTQVAACSPQIKTARPLLRWLQGTPRWGKACPMDDAVPSPPRRSQLHTAACCVGLLC